MTRLSFALLPVKALATVLLLATGMLAFLAVVTVAMVALAPFRSAERFDRAVVVAGAPMNSVFTVLERLW